MANKAPKTNWHIPTCAYVRGGVGGEGGGGGGGRGVPCNYDGGDRSGLVNYLNYYFF